MLNNNIYKPKLLYRYRKYKDFNITALKSFSINGTLYRKFENAGELNIGFSRFIAEKLGYSEEARLKLLNLAIDNCRNNYYLASLTKNKPSFHSKEWRMYADDDGYCLAYYVEDIERAIAKSVSEERMVEIKKVDYSNSPFYLDKFIKWMHKVANNCNTEITLDSFFGHNHKLGKYLVKAFAQKSTKYREFQEYRLIYLTNDKKNHGDYENAIILVRPCKIIFRNNLPFAKKIELMELSKELMIPFECLNDKQS